MIACAIVKIRVMIVVSTSKMVARSSVGRRQFEIGDAKVLFSKLRSSHIKDVRLATSLLTWAGTSVAIFEYVYRNLNAKADRPLSVYYR